MDNEASLKRVMPPANTQVSLRVVVFAISLAALAFATKGFLWISEQILGLQAVGEWLIYLLCAVAIVGSFVNGYATTTSLWASVLLWLHSSGF